ncbi:response regulator transcription factor [Novosphingobium sp. ZW T3_23]|uniref:response regulator transcription factor n=1 Tax=Novosphingobium sp. ZW T3_23 TaxID=3378084 RepID=UPI0038538D13
MSGSPQSRALHLARAGKDAGRPPGEHLGESGRLHDVLIVEDDTLFAARLCKRLRGSGHGVTILRDGEEAMRAVSDGRFDIIVLGLMLRGLDGLSVVRGLRENGVRTPVIMISAFADPAERIDGLMSGADDYMAKPLDTDELHVRIDALMRRCEWTSAHNGFVEAGDYKIDPERLRVCYRGADLALSVPEFRLFAQLVCNAGSILSRQRLFTAVWKNVGMPAANLKRVDTSISRLRRRIVEQVGSDPIVTVRGAGYTVRK